MAEMKAKFARQFNSSALTALSARRKARGEHMMKLTSIIVGQNFRQGNRLSTNEAQGCLLGEE
jgi:hypothetical protein